MFDGSRVCPDALLALRVARGPPTKAPRCPWELEAARKWVAPRSFRKKHPALTSSPAHVRLLASSTQDNKCVLFQATTFLELVTAALGSSCGLRS